MTQNIHASIVKPKGKHMQKCIDWLQGLLTRLLMTVLLVTCTLASAADVITYIHTDISGSPLAATNEAGAVVWKESYRAYGQRAVQMPYSEGQQQWFHGKEQDELTGYQYFGARYYDPAVGRFMGIDPVDFQEGNPHSFNRYGYGNNNPVKYLDPDGRLPVAPFAFLWGVALWADGGGVGPIGTPAGGAVGVATTSTKAAAQAGHKLTPVANAVEAGITSGAYASSRVVAGTGRSVDQLSLAASVADRGGLTYAGRALQKHGNRANSAFPRVTGKPELVNRQGQAVVDDILTNPGSTSTTRNHARFGDVTEIRAPDGRGLRYGPDGRFIGLLEP